MRMLPQMFHRKQSNPHPLHFAEDLFKKDTWSHSASSVVPTVRLDERGSEPMTVGWLLPEGERPQCAAPGCGAQPKFWKKTSRPIFEGTWTCSRSCSKKLVELAVRRQIATAAAFAGTATQHKHRIPLGLILLDQGWVTQFQLRRALDAQREAGHGRIGHWLGETCGVESEKITRALAAQWNRPVLSGVGFVADRMATVMPNNLRREMGVLPLRVAAGKILYIAFSECVDHAAVAVLERMTGLRVESGLLPQEEFAQAESRLEHANPVMFLEETFGDTADLVDGVLDALWHEHPVASRLVAVRGAWWLRMWLERGAFGGNGTLPASPDDVVDVLFRR